MHAHAHANVMAARAPEAGRAAAHNVKRIKRAKDLRGFTY